MTTPHPELEPFVEQIAEVLCASCPGTTNHTGTARSVLKRLRRLGWTPPPPNPQVRPLHYLDPLLRRDAEQDDS